MATFTTIILNTRSLKTLAAQRSLQRFSLLLLLRSRRRTRVFLCSYAYVAACSAAVRARASTGCLAPTRLLF